MKLKIPAWLTRRKNPASPSKSSAQRRIGVVASTQEAAEAFVRGLASRGPDPTGFLVDHGLHAVYVRRTLFRRTRRAELHTLAWPDLGAGPLAPEVEQIDTLIVVLPLDSLAGSDWSQPGAPIDLLSRAMAFGRAQGRLRSIVFAVTEIPGGQGPYHASQVACFLPRAESLPEGIAERIAASAERTGDGFADPRWKQFLLQAVAASGPLTSLHALAARLLGAAPPIFFFPADEDSGTQGALLRWIFERKTAAAESAPGALRVSWRVAAALFVAGALLAWRAAPTRDFVAPEPIQNVAERHASYGPIPRLFLGETSAERDLRAILVERGWLPPVAVEEARAEYAGKLRKLIKLDAKVRDSASAGSPPSRRSVRRAARAVATAVDWRRVWLAEPEIQGLPATTVVPLDDQIERTAVTGAIGATRRNQPETAGALAASMDELGRTSTGQLLRALAQARSPVAFYAAFANTANLPGAPAVCGLLPKPDGPALREALHLQSGSLHWDDDQAALALGLDRLQQQCALLDDSTARAAQEVVTAHIAWLEPKEVTFRCRRMTSDAWHLNVRPAMSSSFLPCRWVAQPGDGSPECLVRFAVKPGETIELAVQRSSAIHVVSQKTNDACAPDDVHPLTISGPRLTFGSGAELTECDAIAGWPLAAALPASSIPEGRIAGADPGSAPFADVEAVLASSARDEQHPIYRVTKVTALGWPAEPSARVLFAACPALDTGQALARFQVGDRLEFRWSEEAPIGRGTILTRGRDGEYTLAAPAGGWLRPCDARSAKATALFDVHGVDVPALQVRVVGRHRPWHGHMAPPPEAVHFRLAWMGTGPSPAGQNVAENAAAVRPSR